MTVYGATRYEATQILLIPKILTRHLRRIECSKILYLSSFHFTDSQSLLKAIQRGSADTSVLKCMFDKPAGKNTHLWIPGQNRIALNEEINAWAKQTRAITSDVPRPAAFVIAGVLVRLTVRGQPPIHYRTKGAQTKSFS